MSYSAHELLEPGVLGSVLGLWGLLIFLLDGKLPISYRLILNKINRSKKNEMLFFFFCQSMQNEKSELLKDFPSK